ncbi:hypothetical protein FA15DRAFT_662832 [Coprinopsis marcescibilis]|uniref:rRNA-processing protein n=1 Tax=Coprinopsis marcescibilis TaxID=230819 RepID=A0A5C3LDP4_COPMA|nr:hypothetical protein FA15DRAFT_662832 [Coprinopsis marcescibilis]
MDAEQSSLPIPLASSSGGRVSGKAWKMQKTATVRSQLQPSLRTKWDDRKRQETKDKAVKKLQTELKEEKEADFQRRRQITMDRKKAAQDKIRIEEEKAKMGARKAARLRRRAGRSKTVNH